MASSISGARTALEAGLASLTATTLAGFVVDRGYPLAEAQRVVTLMGVKDPSEQAAALGAQRRDERYVLEIGVKVHDPAGTAAEVDAAGFDAADAVRAWVAANPTFAPNTLLPAAVTSQTTDGAFEATGGGWVIFIRLAIAVAARIT